MKYFFVQGLRLATILMFFALIAVPSYGQFGIAAGLNFDEFGDVEFDNAEESVDNAMGYHIGLFYDLSAGPLAIRPGVFYRQVGDIEYPRVDDLDFDLSLIEVPIDVRFRLPVPLVTPYLFGGPVFAFASSSDEDFDDSLKDLSISANLGVGVEVPVPVLGITLFPELRYAFGVTSIVDDFEFLGSTVTPDNDSQRLDVFMVRLGLVF